MTARTRRRRMLDGLLVLEAAGGLRAAYLGKLLADSGATVVKLEAQDIPPAAPGERAWLDAGKLSLTAPAPDATDNLPRLLAHADVLIEDVPPSQSLLTGLSIPDPRATYPHLVHTTVTNFGADGPWADRHGTDLIINALSGMASLNNFAGRVPLRQPGQQADLLGAMFGYLGTLAALLNRDVTGRSQHVDISSMEAVASVLTPQFLHYAYKGEPYAQRRPEAEALLRCADGWVSLTPFPDRAWAALTALFNLDIDPTDPRIIDERARRTHQDALRALLDPQFAARTRRELFEDLSAMRVVTGMVLHPRELPSDPHLTARGAFIQQPLAPDSDAAITLPGPAWRIAGERPEPAPPPPAPGADTATVRALLDEPLPSIRPSSSGRSQNGGIAGAGPSDSSFTSTMPPTPGSSHTGARHMRPPALSGPVQPDPPPPLPPTATNATPRLPLEHIRIVDLTQAWAGAYATQLLADLGADVIKIEARSRPDPWRGGFGGGRGLDTYPADLGPGTTPHNHSYLANSVNRNKRGITLDLASPRGKELFLQMVRDADVVAENFTPRVLGNLGLGYDVLNAVRPGIILLSMPAYGLDGPYGGFAGIGGSVEPMSGNSALLGEPGGDPQVSGLMYPDAVAGINGASALLTALQQRDITGEGCHVELSQQESMLAMTGLFYARGGLDALGPQGNADPAMAPHGIYPCAPNAEGWSWLALAVRDDADWQALLTAIDQPALHDPRYATTAGRLAARAQLDRMIEKWTRAHTVAEAEAALLAAGLPAAAVRRTDAVLACPQLAARAFFVDDDHPEVGRRRTAGIAVRLTETPGALRRSSPRHGEHSREVLTTLLHVPEDEYTALAAAGVTGEGPPPDFEPTAAPTPATMRGTR